MKTADHHWKIPVALGIIFSSLIPVALVCFIDGIDFKCSKWAYEHQALPTIAWSFQSCYRVGMALPILTTAAAIWFVVGKTVTGARLAWVALLLIVLHLVWFSWGILGFYLTNQKFVLF
jgi:hypothetical protein